MRASLLARRWGCAVIGVAALLPSAGGQSLLTLLPESPASVSAERLLDPSVLEPLPAGPSGVQRESMRDGAVPEEDLFPLAPQTNKRSLLTLEGGPFVFTFSGEASALYSDNIFLASRHPEADLISTVTPRVLMGAGDYAEQKNTFFAAGFAPSFVIFQDHSEQSGVEYDTFLEGQYSFSRLKLGTRLSYQKLSGDDDDASGRVSRDVYAADFIAEYALSQRTLVEVNGLFTHRDYRSRIDSDEYLTRVFLAYLMSPKLQMALGGSFGMFRPANRLNQTYEEPLLRLWYQASPNLSIRAIGGVDFRQFTEGIPDRLTPAADVAVVYLPSQSENTVLSLGGYRRVRNSVSDPTQNYVANGIGLRVTQRLWRDLYLDLGVGYQDTSYYPVARETVPQRRDGSYYVRPQIRYNLNDWGSVSMFCTWRNNDSTVAGSSWKNEQIGVALTVGF